MKKVHYLAAIVLVLSVAVKVPADETAPRQYYSGWRKTDKFYYRYYYFKAARDDARYKYQYVIFRQKTPEWVYWYNPATKKYWARCPTREHPKYGKDIRAGKDLWSTLDAEFRKDNLNDIADKDFGKVENTSPPIPGSKDKQPIDCPPSDLPKG